MHDFKKFALTISHQFGLMSQHELFRTALDGQDVWEQYLDAFPAGTNDIYRVRRHYDGSYDRNVIRRIGNLVALIDGKPVTIWDAANVAYPFNEVCAVMAARVKTAHLAEIFRAKEHKLGYVSTVEALEGGATKRWEHFHVTIANTHRTDDVGTHVGAFNTNIGVYKRGLDELTLESLDTVLSLIESGALYRGEEFKAKVEAFRKLKLASFSYSGDDRLGNYFLFDSFARQHPANTLIRNTVIGQLLQDLSAGVDLETAVASYERMVAPTNYKRPTALITPSMVKDAQAKLDALGLETALHRRHAVIGDVSVNNVLWVNNDVKAQMKGGIAGLIGDLPITNAAHPKATDISIEAFLRDVLPSVKSMEILFRNPLSANLVSITAPVDADAEHLFKWNNPFAWSYVGNITDSITQRVKTAGGNIDAKLRVSLAWFNSDDLDLHSQCPDGHVFYGSPGGKSYSNRILDVDMNAGGARSLTPVENQSWQVPKDGEYKISVNQFNKRSSSNPGFTLELAIDGQLSQYHYDKAVRDGHTIQGMSFTMKKGALTDLKIGEGLSGGGITQTKWGVNTETFVKVNMLMNSPNYWDENAVGNKHWFFILNGCVNDEPTRGFYNEFLRGDLEQHRKVFEVLGDKTKCFHSDEQLSGLGFSSTKREVVTVRVTNRLYNIQF